jgi:hypothetical protein
MQTPMCYSPLQEVDTYRAGSLRSKFLQLPAARPNLQGKFGLNGKWQAQHISHRQSPV